MSLSNWGKENPKSKFLPEKHKGSETSSFLLLVRLMLVLRSVELKVSGHICCWTFYKGFCAVLVNVEEVVFSQPSLWFLTIT